MEQPDHQSPRYDSPGIRRLRHFARNGIRVNEIIGYGARPSPQAFRQPHPVTTHLPPDLPLISMPMPSPWMKCSPIFWTTPSLYTHAAGTAIDISASVVADDQIHFGNRRQRMPQSATRRPAARNVSKILSRLPGKWKSRRRLPSRHGAWAGHLQGDH